MRILLPAALLAVLASGCYATTTGSYGYSGTVTATTVAPDLVYVSPGVQVIADYDEPIFYTDGYYWREVNGTWYRSTVHTGSWVYASPPRTVISIGNRHTYRRYRPAGYRPRANRGYDRPVVRDNRSYGRDNRGYDRPVTRDHRTYDRPVRDNRSYDRPVVRDNRSYDRPVRDNRSYDRPVVRDNRTYNRPAPTVRDNRTYNRPAPTVRDNRTYNRPAPTVRDNRTYNRPAPTVRDNRKAPTVRDNRSRDNSRGKRDYRR